MAQRPCAAVSVGDAARRSFRRGATGVCLAAGQGFEPRYHDPESCVLPLDDPAVGAYSRNAPEACQPNRPGLTPGRRAAAARRCPEEEGELVRIATALLIAATSCIPLHATAAEGITLDSETMKRTAEEFYSVGLDASNVYPVGRLSLQRDRLKIELEGGSVVLAQPLLGRVTGACYRGRARLSLTPPTPTERASLKARIGSEEFGATVDALYLRFNDSTAADLTSGLQPSSNPPTADRCSKMFSSRHDVVRRYELGTVGLAVNLETDFVESTLSPALARNFFLLEAEAHPHGWITYIQRPGIAYSAVLMRLKPVGSLFEPELWAMYEAQESPPERSAQTRALDILHNQMEVVIPNRTEFTIDSLISYRLPVEARTARFALINSYGGSTWDDSYGRPVKVNHVSLENGAPLPFLHRRHELLVQLPAALPAGTEAKLRIKASEKTISQITPESFGLLDTYPWFPQETTFLGGAYAFDWTVKVMRNMSAAGTGLTIREWDEKDTKLNCAQWKSEAQVTFPSLIFGQFRETRGEYRRKQDGSPVAIRLHWMPSITLTDLSGEGGPDVESAGGTTEQLTVPAGKPSQIVKEAGIILDYYEQILGPYPYEELDIAQMGPGRWFGQAPPGLVQITAEYFLSQALIHSALDGAVGLQNFLTTVLAHEIAHHYWGGAVSWKSDQETWLSESLAEYSAALYLQASEGDKAFRQKRELWRKQAIQWEGTLPIIHAGRAAGENGPAVQAALLYNKGPLIVHMLRVQVGDENFVKILKKVLTDYRGRAIDTSDFQAAAEAIVGYKLGWFFDQWIREAGIPELRFSYSVSPTPDGKFLLKARLAQSGPAGPKALFVPLAFEFGEDKRGQKEWRVKGADETLQLMLPQKPVKVLIDEGENLLAKIIYENGG